MKAVAVKGVIIITLLGDITDTSVVITFLVVLLREEREADETTLSACELRCDSSFCPYESVVKVAFKCLICMGSIPIIHMREVHMRVDYKHLVLVVMFELKLSFVAA